MPYYYGQMQNALIHATDRNKILQKKLDYAIERLKTIAGPAVETTREQLIEEARQTVETIMRGEWK